MPLLVTLRQDGVPWRGPDLPQSAAFYMLPSNSVYAAASHRPRRRGRLQPRRTKADGSPPRSARSLGSGDALSLTYIPYPTVEFPPPSSPAAQGENVEFHPPSSPVAQGENVESREHWDVTDHPNPGGSAEIEGSFVL